MDYYWVAGKAAISSAALAFRLLVDASCNSIHRDLASWLKCQLLMLSQELQALLPFRIPPFASGCNEALHSLFAARHERA